MSRFAKPIVLYLAMGCTTTLMVCWMIALRADLNSAPRHNRVSGFGMTGVWDRAGRTVWIFNLQHAAGFAHMTLSNRGEEPLSGFNTVPAQNMIELTRAPGWSTIHRGDRAGVHGTFYIEQAFGWPLYAMAQRHRFPSDANQSNSVDGFLLPVNMLPAMPGRHLPLRMVWPGFVADAILFAWLWYAVVAFPMVLVRGRRRRRGACTSCGYDVRYTPAGKPCPECGVTPRK